MFPIKSLFSLCRRTVITVISLVSLGFVCPILNSGCTVTQQWVKAGAEPGYADQQQAACTLQSETSYMSSEESEEARASRIARWVSLCMRANGWRQQEVAPAP